MARWRRCFTSAFGDDAADAPPPLPATSRAVPSTAAPCGESALPFRCEDRANIPDELVRGPFEDFSIAGDVYATAYLIARNATPEMYSFLPWVNPDVRIVWLYGVFVICSQLFVIYVSTFLYPPSIQTDRVFADCGNATAVAGLHARGFLAEASAESCRSGGTFAFEADVRGVPTAFVVLERSTHFHHSILTEGGGVVLVLRVICCIWIFSRIYFQEFENVVSLLAYHDFSCWFLPLKGERVRNTWSLAIPLIQYAVLFAIATVSFVMVCAHSEPFDIVMNSLAFTFIAEVGVYFHSPLAKRMAATQIQSLSADYGEDPIYYLYTEYRESNAISDGVYMDKGWYIVEDEEKAGLLNDFAVRHNPAAYPRPCTRLARLLELALFVVPPAVVLLGAVHSRCWWAS
eukprot:TRINITY_DN20049_c0_g3_i2.p1 TRINITY_DN20049_c0_g3~~TRINITY_DN20049_c0_g3_i2.p1  ORF type:complete len:422 (-),score=70.58 TRINITY_DN20049_c0_g3_i2:644-1852(-)